MGAYLQPACPCPSPCCLEMQTQSISRCSIKETYCTHLPTLKGKKKAVSRGRDLNPAADVDMRKTFNPRSVFTQDKIQEAHINTQTYHRLRRVCHSVCVLVHFFFFSPSTSTMVSSCSVGTKSCADCRSVLHMGRNKISTLIILYSHSLYLLGIVVVLLVAFRYAISHHSAEGLGRKKRSRRAQATQSQF